MSETIMPSWTVNPNEAFYNGPKGSNFYIADIKSNSAELQADLNLLNNSPIPVGAYVMISYRGTEDIASYQSNKSTDGINLNSSIWQKQILNTSEIADYENNNIRILQATSTTSPKWCYVFITSSQGEMGDSINIIDTFNVDTTKSYEIPNDNGTTTVKKLDEIGFENFETQDALDNFLNEVFEYYYKAPNNNHKEFNNLNDTVIGNFYLYKTYNTTETLQKIYMSVYYICNNKTDQTYFISKISGYYTPPKELTSINGFEYNERTGSLRIGNNYSNSGAIKNQQIAIGENINCDGAKEGSIFIGQNINPTSNTLFALNVDPQQQRTNNLLEIKEIIDENQQKEYALQLNGKTIGDTVTSLGQIQSEIELIKNIPTVKPYFSESGDRIYYNNEQAQRSFISLGGQIQQVKEDHWQEFFISEIPIRINIILPSKSSYASLNQYTHYVIYGQIEGEKTIESFTTGEVALPPLNDQNNPRNIVINKDYYSNQKVNIFIGYRNENDIYANRYDENVEYKAYNWITKSIDLSQAQVVKLLCTSTKDDSTDTVEALPLPNTNNYTKDKIYYDDFYNLKIATQKTANGPLELVEVKDYMVAYKIINSYGVFENFNEKTAYSVCPELLECNIDDLPIMNVDKGEKLQNTIFVKNKSNDSYIYCGIAKEYFERSDVTPFIFRENEYFQATKWVSTGYKFYKSDSYLKQVQHPFIEQLNYIDNWRLISQFVHSDTIIKDYLKSKWKVGDYKFISGEPKNQTRGQAAVVIAGIEHDYYDITAFTEQKPQELDEDGNNIIYEAGTKPNLTQEALFTFMVGYILNNEFYSSYQIGGSTYWWSYQEKAASQQETYNNLLNEKFKDQKYYKLTNETPLLRRMGKSTSEDSDPILPLQSLIKIVIKATPNADGHIDYSEHKVFIPSEGEVIDTTTNTAKAQVTEKGPYRLFIEELNNIHFTGSNLVETNTPLMYQLRNPSIYTYSDEEPEQTWLFYVPSEKQVIKAPTKRTHIVNNDYTYSELAAEPYNSTSKNKYYLGTKETNTSDGRYYSLRMFCL